MTSKRPRDDNEAAAPSWWGSTGDWVCSNGGKIHPSLVLTENRDIVTKTSVPKDEVLLDIPAACLVSQETVLSTETGKGISSILNDESIEFYNQRQDLLIAMCLASEQQKFKYYLDTLPPSSDYDLLPRRGRIPSYSIC